MKRLKAAALLVLLANTLLSFEARAALVRVAVAPVRSGVHQAFDVDNRPSKLMVTGYRILCHRPARIARLTQAEPSLDTGAWWATARPLPVPSRLLRRSFRRRVVARPCFLRRPDADRAPPA